MIICDRCGKAIYDNDSLGKVINEAIRDMAVALGVKEDLPVVIRGKNRIDLCDDCRTALNQWLKEADNDNI